MGFWCSWSVGLDRWFTNRDRLVRAVAYLCVQRHATACRLSRHWLSSIDRSKERLSLLEGRDSGSLRKLAPSQAPGDWRLPGRTETGSWPGAPTTPHRSACSATRQSAGSTRRWRLTSHRIEDSAGCAAAIQNPWSWRPFGPTMHKLGRTTTSHGPRRKARKHACEWPGNRNVSDRDNGADIFGHPAAARNCRSAKKCRGARGACVAIERAEAPWDGPTGHAWPE